MTEAILIRCHLACRAMQPVFGALTQAKNYEADTFAFQKTATRISCEHRYVACDSLGGHVLLCDLCHHFVGLPPCAPHPGSEGGCKTAEADLVQQHLLFGSRFNCASTAEAMACWYWHCLASHACTHLCRGKRLGEKETCRRMAGLVTAQVLLLLTNLEATSCLEFLGGQGC